MLEVLDIPREMLPEVRRSSEVYGQTNIGGKGGTRIPISGSPVTSRPRCLVSCA